MINEKAISKIILSGEHSVVYGKPAIALPVFGSKSSVKIFDNSEKSGFIIKAPQLEKTFYLNEKKDIYNPIELTVINFLNNNEISLKQNIIIEIFSEIPIASGMGSGASISSALIKVLARFFNIPLSKKELYTQVFEIEKIYHGNPSGVDPTVIIYKKPLYFIKGKTPEFITKKTEPNYCLAIIDSKIRSSTIEVVNLVKQKREANTLKYDRLFDEIEMITEKIKSAFCNSDIVNFGLLMNENQIKLKEIGVSNDNLDSIITLSKKFGSLGSKISGAGLGGVLISLIEKEKIDFFRNSFIINGLNVTFTLL